MKTLQAVICSINSKYIHSSLAPWYLAAAVRNSNHPGISVSVCEGTINESVDAVLNRLLQRKPQVVGFSCYIWNITFIKTLSRLLRQALPDCIILFGGPEVSYNADNILRENSQVDFVISGEGELPFAELLFAIQQNRTPSGIGGVCYRDGSDLRIMPPHISNDTPPVPYTDDYFAALHGRIAYIESSRGCPFSCAFCLSGQCGEVRFFDFESTKQQILKLAASGAKTIKFIDRTFNADQKRADAIWKFIIENYGKSIPKDVCFHFEIGGDLLDDRLLTRLSTAPVGLFQLEIGIQSFDEQVLASVCRKTSLSRLEQNLQKLLAMENMHIHVDLIAGLPFDTLDRFVDSFHRAYALRPHMLQLGFLKLLHGSPMEKIVEGKEYTFSPSPPYEVFSTPWMNSKDLSMLRKAEGPLDKLYNSGRFLRTLNYLTNQLFLPPFSLFFGFGTFLETHPPKNSSLSEYAAAAYQYFSGIPGVSDVVLRDCMICDFLSFGMPLPEFLKIYDKKLKFVKSMLSTLYNTEGKNHVRRFVSLLNRPDFAVYVDCQNKHPVTKQYPLKMVDISTGRCYNLPYNSAELPHE